MAVKVGFVGAGWVAGQHMDALRQIPEARVVAVTDLDEDKAVEAAAKFAGAGAFTDWRAMLDEGGLDAAYVCLPPHVHGEPEMALIEAGLPFFMEKPVANELETPRRILKALEGRDLTVSVGYLWRYRESVARVKEFLAAQEPVVARGAYACSVPPPPWWRRKEQSGGQVVEQTTHVFDLSRYLLGEPEWVFCAARRGLVTEVEDYDTDDASVCTIGFQSGVLCSITSTCAVREGDLGEVSLEVFGREGRAKLGGFNLEATISTAGRTTTHKSAENAFLKEDTAFIEAVAGGDPSGIKSTYEDACRTQALTCAATEAMESGEVVRL